MKDFNTEPLNMVRISEFDYANVVMHYKLGTPELRQPYINKTADNGSYKLRMFPLAYEGFEELGFAYRIKADLSLVYYRYGNELLWNELEKGYNNQFQYDL